MYDNVPPTIDNISDFEIDDGGSWTTLNTNDKIGDGAEFRHRINFSEKIKASGTSIVTYNTTGSKSIPDTKFYGNSIDAGMVSDPYYVTVSHIIDGDNHVGANPVTISSISDDGGWRDVAGNAMAVSSGNFPIAGANLSSVKSVEVDLTKPYIASVTATPLTGNFGIHDAINNPSIIPITIIFNEEVTLDASATITVYVDAKATGLSAIGSADITTPSGENFSQATVTYQVAEGDASTSLDVSSIEITGSDFTKLKDDLHYNSNSAASLVVPGGNSLADNTTLVIETTRPIIGKISSTYGNGTYGEDKPVAFAST